jgi:hypothetical protein
MTCENAYARSLADCVPLVLVDLVQVSQHLL